MIGRHQLLDRLDILPLEGRVERLGGLVHLGDDVFIAGARLDQASQGEDHEHEQDEQASHATSRPRTKHGHGFSVVTW